MRKILLPALFSILLCFLAVSCWKPYPGDLEVATLHLTIGRSLPADIIAVLGEPKSHESLDGKDTYVFGFYRTALRVFVGVPGAQDDKIIMIDGAEDNLHAVFTEGVLTEAW
ncbi:MAG: hypothetical protein LBF40_09035 [Deltaproteobacteria bacterium]|jgi:hypothetical protein|nr:hypothetical protein [Deltaproteobacteria bacterium]